MDEKFVERSTDSKQIFEGKLLKVYQHNVLLPCGRQAGRKYIKHPATVIIVAMFDNGKGCASTVFAQHNIALELPAGRIDPGEKPRNAVKWALLKETGHVAAKWTPLLLIHPCIGYSSETADLRGEQARLSGHRIDQQELVEASSLPLAGAIASVASGTITDGQTISALLLTEQALSFGRYLKKKLRTPRRGTVWMGSAAHNQIRPTGEADIFATCGCECASLTFSAVAMG